MCSLAALLVVPTFHYKPHKTCDKPPGENVWSKIKHFSARPHFSIDSETFCTTELHSCEWGPRAGSLSITGELVRNAESRVPPDLLTPRALGGLCAPWNVNSSAVVQVKRSQDEPCVVSGPYHVTSDLVPSASATRHPSSMPRELMS